MFIATTAGTPNLLTFSICFSKFANPLAKASRFSLPSSSFLTPPLYLRALTVATITAASGLSPANLALISKNFSAPKSAPNPASATVYSANFKDNL